MSDREFVVPSDCHSMRLDSFVAKCTGSTRSLAQKVISSGNASINGSVSHEQDFRIKNGDILVLEDFKDSLSHKTISAKPVDIKLDLVFENDNLLVINKQAGLVVHPGAGNANNTLVNALVHRYGPDSLSKERGPEKLGIVHRLDKDTSGLMLVAKNDFAHHSLSAQISEKSCIRKYLALCYGTFVPSSGEIKSYVRKDPKDHTRMIVDIMEEGKIAITKYKTKSILLNGAISVVEFQLHTGRTHQIRVHALHMKHPIIGDMIYKRSAYSRLLIPSDKRDLILSVKRQLLHSCYIEFTEPTTMDRLQFCTDIPDDM